METDLNARYGRTPSRHRRDRRVFIAVATGFAIVLLAWLVWAAADQPSNDLDARDHSFTLIDNNTVSVRFTLSVTPGTTTSCAIQALSEQYSIVGWKIVAIPAAEDRSRLITESVQTTGGATTGLIYRCWVG